MRGDRSGRSRAEGLKLIGERLRSICYARSNTKYLSDYLLNRPGPDRGGLEAVGN